jgi:hypothetical protein
VGQDDDIVEFEGARSRFGGTWTRPDGIRARRAGYLTVAAGAAVAATGVTMALTVPAGASPAGVSGTMRLQGVTTSAAAVSAQVIAYGAFTAYGTGYFVDDTTDKIAFADGAFMVSHPAPSGGNPVFNTKTCLAQFTEKGTYTLSGGTGRYKGIGGHGTYTASILAIVAKTRGGACDENTRPVAYQQEITASGPVHLP